MTRNHVAALGSFAFIVVLLGTCACSPRGSGGATPTFAARVELAPIEKLDVLTRESFPPGYTLAITSGLPSGCAKFDAAVITGRSGNTITVRVTNTLPADRNVACTAIYGYHETNVDLGQDFVSGSRYVVEVNDKETSFVAQ